MGKRGGPSKIGGEQRGLLREMVSDRPRATLGEIAEELERRAGIRAHEATIGKALREAGVHRVRGEEQAQRLARESGQRDGYSEVHRRFDAQQRSPSCLTDAEWSLVKDLFENEGRRGKPAQVSRRELVDACCYVVRSGCAWRMLAREFPPRHNVYKAFRRWSAQGKFERMHDRLRELWRQREGRDQAPSAAVLDAQSTRGSPQGGPSGYEAGKKIKGRKRSLAVGTLGSVLGTVDI